MTNTRSKIFRGQDVRFRLDLDTVELLKGEVRVPLPPQQMDLLLYFVNDPNPRRLISRGELLDSLWGGGADPKVYDAALSTAVKGLREALGDDAKKPMFIETVHGRGFRFVAVIEDKGSGGQVQPTSKEAPPPLDKTAVNEHAVADGKPDIDPGPPQDNEHVMSTIRKWKRRPGSCGGEELVGRFQVDACYSGDWSHSKVLGIPPGDAAEIILDTPRELNPTGDREWLRVSAVGRYAQLLEELAEKKDRSTVLLHVRGYGAYVWKSDFPDLETGKMHHIRDPKPAVLVLSARMFQDDHAEETADSQAPNRSDPTSVKQAQPVDERRTAPVTPKQRDAIRAERNRKLVAALKVQAGITKCTVFQLEDHTDKGYLIRVKFDPERQSAAGVTGLVRQTLDTMTPHVPFWGELMSESSDSVSFGYSYIDEHNRVFKA